MKKIYLIYGEKGSGKTKLAHDIICQNKSEFISFKHFLEAKEPDITKILIDGFKISEYSILKEYATSKNFENLCIVLISDTNIFEDSDIVKRHFDYCCEIKCSKKDI